jgi:hypothetical protein
VLGNFNEPTDWAPDAGHGTISSFVDAPWLSEDPTSGEVAPGESVEITLTLGGAGFAPGSYEAVLVLLTNAPKQSALLVDVGLEIGVPEGFGGVAGDVSDAHTGAPLGATVTVHAEWQGEPLDVSATTTDGRYQLLAPAGNWPVEFTADGYVSETQTVEIVAGFTSSGVDAALHRLQAHAELEPGSLSFVLLPGEAGRQTLTLGNPAGHEDLTFTIGEAVLPVAVNTSTAQVRPAGLTSRTAPTGHVNRAAPRSVEGSPVLVLMDFFPWDSDALLQVLDANGIAFDIAGSDSMADLDLSVYQMVMVSSDQPQGFYDAFTASSDAFTDYVAAGGLLWFGGAAWGFAGGEPDGLQLPGGATLTGPVIEDFNDVVELSHPLVLGVPDPFRGDFASHATFSNLPAGTTVIATGESSGQPTLIEYDFGAGRVLAFGQTLEFAWMFGQDGGTILENGVPYAYSFIPFSDVPWLSEDPAEGTVAPDGSLEIHVDVDAAGLQPGLYGARVIILTNDPDHRRISVPVLLTVPAYRQGINAGGRAYTTTAGLPYAADTAFKADSFGYVKGAAKQTKSTIAGTDDQPLYQSQREDMERYRFTVPEGRYRVLLQFAEFKKEKNQRVFTVGVEGQAVLFQAEIATLAGGRLTAYELTTEVDVTDGVLDIQFVSNKGDKPVVNAILVTHLPVNAGAPAE